MQLAEKFDEVDVQCYQPIAKLDDVKPSFTAFHFADQGLVTTQTVSEVGLAEALSEARAVELLQEYLVVTGVKSLGHGGFRAAP